MERPRSKRAIILCVVLLFAVGIAAICFRAYDPTGRRVRQILLHDMIPAGASTWDQGMSKLWALGPGVIPCLATETSRKDAPFSKSYARLFQKSPPWLKRFLPAPVSRADLRDAAMHAIDEFGPLAARRSAPQVIAAVGEKDFFRQNYSRACLRWLVPDSPAALAALKYGLSGVDTNWPAPEKFLSPGDSVWPGVPEVAPLLARCLRNSGEAYLAAIALGRIGSNAATAIPPLIETVDFAAAGVTSAAAARNHVAEVYSTGLGIHLATVIGNDKDLNHNRAMAALALGRIGLATPEVCAALARAWNYSPDPWVRHNAALAVAMLGPPMTNQLPALLSGLKDIDCSALGSKLDAIGKLGPGALDALPVLRDLSQTNLLASLVTNSSSQIVGQSIDDLSVSAKIAICRIHPDEDRAYLPDIATKIGRAWEPVVFLSEAGRLSNDIVRVAEPLLDDTTAVRRSLAAYIILSHDRQHARALEGLRRAKSGGEINDRLLAGRFLYLAVGDTNGLCAIISEALRDTRSFTGQSAGNAADMMGTNALPLIPALKAAVWSKDRFVRERAGAVLIKLAPQEIPINGPK